MQKWEYKVVDGWLDEGGLNQLGLEGWELVQYDASAGYFFFKRPKQ